MAAVPRQTPRKLTQSDAARALDSIVEALCRKSLAAFLKRAWPILNPGDGRALQWNWHHEALCEHLMAVAHGQIQKLVVSVAPGHTKTSAVSVALPAWMWTFRPQTRVISASYEQTLSNKANRDRRALVESEWYRRTFRPAWNLDPLNRVEEFASTAGGSMMSTSVGGRGTGRHGDLLLIDDPLRAEGIYTSELADHVRWYVETFSSRVVDPKKSAQVLIMQRLHKLDLAGVLIEQGWDHLFLPTEYSAAKSKVTSIGWRDPRTVEGELLFPARFSPEYVARLKGPTGIGAIAFAAQQNQDPVAGEGNIFKRPWFRRFWELMPENVDEILASWDFAFRKGISTDFVVGQVWARCGADFYLLDEVRGRMDFTESLKAVVDLHAKWRDLLGGAPIPLWLIEAKANGDAIITTLKKHIPGIVPIDPHGTKEARAAAIAPFAEAGNIVLPHPRIAPWVDGWLVEIGEFPLGAHDDRVDAMSQAIDRLRTGAVAYTLPDLREILGMETVEEKKARASRPVRASRPN